MGLWSCDATSFFVSWVHDCTGDGLHEFFPCPYPYLNASNSVYMKILSVILRRNLFPENLIKKYISKYIQTAVNGGKTQLRSGVEFQETPKFYFKIPYVEHFLVTAQRSIRKLANQLCNPIDRRLVFTTFEIKNIFGVDDSVPERLRTHVVRNFCLQVLILVILVKPADISPHKCARIPFRKVFERFYSSAEFRVLLNILQLDCFEILDFAATKYH